MDDRPSAGFREADHYGRTLQRLQAEVARLTEQLRIATEILEAFAGQRGQDMRYPGEHATLAEDALIRMSVVE